MLKHIVATHENEDMNTIKFKMKIVGHTRTSFERQIKESVLIQHKRKNHHLLNSRSEYNRCSLPRLCTQVGDGEYKKYNKELELEKQEEEKLENKIRELRKVKNKARLHPTREQGPSQKRRRLNSNEYINITKVWGEPEKTTAEKNKENTAEQENTNRNNKKKRTESPRPPRGSPSPGNPSTSEKKQETPIIEEDKKERIERNKHKFVQKVTKKNILLISLEYRKNV